MENIIIIKNNNMCTTMIPIKKIKKPETNEFHFSISTNAVIEQKVPNMIIRTLY